MKRQPFTLLIHIALAVIVVGALTTHFFGIQGELFLPDGGEPVDSFTKTSGPGDGRFPFEVALDEAEIRFYPGTSTPMDFCSHLTVGGRKLDVSMNKVGRVDGWRFYQSGISPEGTTLSVSRDPWGIGITYTGYALLGIGMIGFFFQKKTVWRALLKARKATLVFAAAAASLSAAAADLPAMQAPLARNFGKVYVYWNDRVCPMQTMARDVTLKLYGSDSYKGLTAEQVLSGWLFYFETWQRDFNNTLAGIPAEKRQEKDYSEREALVTWLGTGDAFKIYPYHTAAGHTEWLSLTGRRPSCMSLEQWRFMQTAMPSIKALLLEGKNIKANEELAALVENQVRYAGAEYLPSSARMTAERLYNRAARPGMAAAAALLLALFYLARGIAAPRAGILVKGAPVFLVALWALAAYVLLVMAAIWWISGHLPVSNGPETMMFMALAALVGALFVRNDLPRGALLCVAALALLVSAIGGRTPRIGALMPVLASPLLSVHVMLVMLSYTLFILMAVLSAVALCSNDEARRKSLALTNRVILTPAVFLLAAGIFVGAVWANCSWGRYWGWDPKETSALVMLLIYALPLHSASRPLAWLNRPKALHLFLLIAVLAVAFTYFGANYLLPGKHSYA